MPLERLLPGGGEMTGPSSSRNPVDKLVSARSAFGEHAEQWADYTESPLGRLRHGIVMHHLVSHLGSCRSELRVLDAGGGTGTYALEFAQRGDHVCLVDISQEMLRLARGIVASQAPKALAHIEFCCLAVEEAKAHFAPHCFDLVLCHTLLEYVERPARVLQDLVTLVRPGALISIVVVNPFSDALRCALVGKDLTQSLHALHGHVSKADLFGLQRRMIALDSVRDALARAGVRVVGEYGVRVFADYMSDEELADDEFNAKLWQLEVAASGLDPYRRIARYAHVLGIRTEAEL